MTATEVQQTTDIEEKKRDDVTEGDEEEEEEEDVPITKFGNSRDSMFLANHKGSDQERSIASTVPPSGDMSLKHQDSLQSTNSQASQVHFGKVRVHKHRMTLGDNPEAAGVPVTLGWDVEDSQEFGNVDSFEESESSSDHKGLRKITKNRRNLIAQQHHSRSSIMQVQEEIKHIKLSRQESGHENIRKALAKEERQRKKEKSLIGRMFRKGKGKGKK